MIAPIQSVDADASRKVQCRNVANVVDFGARPDRDFNSVEAIQDAIRASCAGGTVQFQPGRYRIDTPILLTGNRKYRGEDGAVLVSGSSTKRPLMIATRLSDLTITGLEFSGAGLRVGDGGRRVRIEGNTFRDIFDPQAPFGQEVGVFVAGSLHDSRISDNLFANIGFSDGRNGSPSGCGILGYNLSGVRLERNKFQDIYQGISIILESNTREKDLDISSNTVINPRRIGIEVQGRAEMHGVRVLNNEVRYFGKGIETLGMSIVAERGHETLIKGNTVVLTNAETEPCAGMGIEASGIDTLVTANHIEGNWCSAIGIYSANVQRSHVEGNSICAHKGQYPAISFYKGKGDSTEANNEISSSCR